MQAAPATLASRRRDAGQGRPPPAPHAYRCIGAIVLVGVQEAFRQASHVRSTGSASRAARARARARAHTDTTSWADDDAAARTAVMVLAVLSSLDQRLTARVNALELPLAIETLIMPFGCMHGYAGGIIGMPLLWVVLTGSLGCWEGSKTGLPSGRAGFFFYMYTSAVGQTISGALKIILNRTRPGMDFADRPRRQAQCTLPHRHWLPGSPAYIAGYSEKELRYSPLVLLGGMQHGVTKGLNGSESGSFPSGDSMAGCCFAALLCW